MATPPRRSLRGSARYGKRLPWTVTGASGSSAERRSAHTRFPPRLPKRFWACCSSSAESSSRPPPLPKIPPMRLAVAITSVTFQSSGPGLPIAAYSPGIFSGLMRASLM